MKRNIGVGRLLSIVSAIIVVVRNVDGKLLDTSVSCDQSNFVLSLNFDMPFRGLIYSEVGFPNCIYINGTMLSQSSYQLKIPLMGCETKINGDGNFENAIIIQENSAFVQSTDKKYLLTCIPSTPIAPTAPPNLFGMDARESMITVNFGSVTVENSRSTTEIIRGMMQPSADDAQPPSANLKYAVEIRNGHSVDAPPLTAALNIGDPIAYMVRLQKPVSSSQIGRCWASDAKSSLELSNEHGCTLQPRGNIWSNFEQVQTADEVIFINRIRAWAFPTSNEVNIFCNLRICMSRVCSFPTCPPSTTNNVKNDGVTKQPNLYVAPATTTTTARPPMGGNGGVPPEELFFFHHLSRAKRRFSFSDLTEVETLSTRLRFRRQSLQRMRTSETELITICPSPLQQQDIGGDSNAGLGLFFADEVEDGGDSIGRPTVGPLVVAAIGSLLILVAALYVVYIRCRINNRRMQYESDRSFHPQ